MEQCKRAHQHSCFLLCDLARIGGSVDRRAEPFRLQALALALLHDPGNDVWPFSHGVAAQFVVGTESAEDHLAVIDKPPSVAFAQAHGLRKNCRGIGLRELFDCLKRAFFEQLINEFLGCLPECFFQIPYSPGRQGALDHRAGLGVVGRVHLQNDARKRHV